MPDNDFVTKSDIEAQSLIPYTDIQNVELISIDARAPESRLNDAHIQLRIEDAAFQAHPEALHIKVTATVEYRPLPERGTQSTAEEALSAASPQLSEAETEELPDPVASISLCYLITLWLDKRVNPEDIDKESVNVLMEMNTIFMLYPYVRAAVQRLSGEMPFPHTVLPYMRR